MVLVSFKGYPVEVVDTVALGNVVVVVNIIQWVIISGMPGGISRCSCAWYSYCCC